MRRVYELEEEGLDRRADLDPPPGKEGPYRPWERVPHQPI